MSFGAVFVLACNVTFNSLSYRNSTGYNMKKYVHLTPKLLLKLNYECFLSFQTVIFYMWPVIFLYDWISILTHNGNERLKLVWRWCVRAETQCDMFLVRHGQTVIWNKCNVTRVSGSRCFYCWMHCKRSSVLSKCIGIYLELLPFLIITTIFINCNWVVTRWQWLFYVYTNMKKSD